MSLGCKFSQLQYYQILLKSINSLPTNHKNKKSELFFIHSVDTICRRGREHTRGVQKVRRLTQLTTRYVHHILSLFNIDTCNWNALGPAFLQRFDTVVEELLFLVFQPAICRAIRTRLANTVGDGVVQSRHFGWQPVLELTCDQMRCSGSKWLPYFPKLKECMKRHNFLTTRTLSARHMAGWKTKNNTCAAKENQTNSEHGNESFHLCIWKPMHKSQS